MQQTHPGSSVRLLFQKMIFMVAFFFASFQIILKCKQIRQNNKPSIILFIQFYDDFVTLMFLNWCICTSLFFCELARQPRARRYQQISIRKMYYRDYDLLKNDGIVVCGGFSSEIIIWIQRYIVIGVCVSLLLDL